MILFFFARLFGYQFHVSCPHSPTRGKHTAIAQEVSYEGEGRHGGEDGRKASCGTSVWELWQLPKAELGQREKKNPESFPLAPTFLGEELDGGEGERRPEFQRVDQLNENNPLRAPEGGGGPRGRSVIGGGRGQMAAAPLRSIKLRCQDGSPRLLRGLVGALFFKSRTRQRKTQDVQPPQRGAWAVPRKARLGGSLFLWVFRVGPL